MNRFTRFSRISPLELYLEHERRAWRCGVSLFALFLAVAVGALFCRAPQGYTLGGQEPDFVGILVTKPHAEPAPALDARECNSLTVNVPLPQVGPSFTPVLSATVPAPEWPEAPEWELAVGAEEDAMAAAEDALVPPLPEEISTPAPALRRRSVAAVSAGGRQGGEETVKEVVAARYRLTPRPPYPPSLRSRRVQGKVGLRIEIDDEGVPLRVDISSSSGYAAFDRSAREWVLAHWRFHPARRGELAVASIVHTRVEFCLH